MQTQKNIEIELKFPLLNPNEAIEKLNKIANPSSQNKYQKDSYYTPPHKDFTKEEPIIEWLRIRKSDKGSSINYKNWHNKGNNKAISCDEFETKIDDDEALEKIFENLGLKHIITIEKKRSTWNHKDVEIAIDNVANLGDYIELEAKGTFSSIDEAKKRLYNILEEINIKTGKQDFKGYPYLMLIKKGLIKETS